MNIAVHHRRLHPFVCLLLIGLAISLPTSAKGDDNPIKFRRYSLEQGLSQGTISSLAQDQQGFLWIGTQDGLNRFDGYQFTIYRHDDEQPQSLPSDYIHSLLVDEQGVLWVGSSKGLSRFNQEINTFRHFTLAAETRENMGSQFISKIYPAENGQLWIATLDGLYLFDPRTATTQVYQHDDKDPSSLVDNRVTALFQDTPGQLWVGTESGLELFHLDSKTFEHFRHDPMQSGSLSGDNITSIVRDLQGYLWVGTYYSGLNKLNTKTKQVTRYRHDPTQPNSIGHDRVRALLLERDGGLWIGSRGGASLFDPDNNQFINYRNDPAVTTSLSNDHIWAILEDNNDSIWFATGDGLNQFVKSTRHFGHHYKSSVPGTSISHKRVRALFKETDGTLWIGVDNGLNRRDPLSQKYQYYQHDATDPKSISNGMIMTVLVDSKGRTWAGSYDGGLNLLLPNGDFQHFTHNKANVDSLNHDRVYSLLEDSQGFIWVGTLDGLHQLDPETGAIKRYLNDPDDPFSLGQNSVYAMLQAPDGNLWIATRNGGLNQLNMTTKQFKRYEHDPNNPSSISHNRVFALYQADPRTLWLATSSGLNQFDIKSEQFTHFGKKQGLINDTVYAVTGDAQGNIWVSTNRGLARFDPKTALFKTFSAFDGLQSDEFNNGAYFKAADGELLFGGINGFNRFYPAKIHANPKPPEIIITALLLSNQPQGLFPANSDSPLAKVISQTKRLTLDHHHPVFSFEFAALHYVNPRGNKYAYRLEGFDQQWTFTDAEHRRATYTNLPAGSYRFEVKAANSDGVWNSNPQEINIDIEPAPWLSAWAYLLYVTAIGSVVMAFAWQAYQKQQVIRTSEKRLSLALWGSGNEFWDWNMSTGALVRANNHTEFAMPNALRYSFDTLKPQIHPDDFEPLRQAFADHAAGKTDYFESAYRLRNKQGEWTWVLDRGQIVKRNELGEPIRALGTVQNINELKQIEARLRTLNEELETRVATRTAQLEATVQDLANTNTQLQQTQQQLVEAEKMASLAGLVAGIAHEINTPIGICITGSSTLANAGIQFFDLQTNKKLTVNDFVRFKETFLASLQLISNNLERTAQLVQSFKMVSVQQNIDQATVCNINQLFDALVATHKEKLQQAHINLTTSGATDLTLVTYRSSLELVLNQLLENSIGHGLSGQQGGDIELSVDFVENYILLRYRDNGLGLDVNDKSKLFEPFFTTQRSSGHLGLGLHVVYNHISQRLGGSIEVDHSVTQGLGYLIKLPKELP